MASEFASRGRCEISSFHGFVTGIICSADTIASASGVLNRVGVETIGAGPRIRPSWLMRSATPSPAINNHARRAGNNLLIRVIIQRKIGDHFPRPINEQQLGPWIILPRHSERNGGIPWRDLKRDFVGIPRQARDG